MFSRIKRLTATKLTSLNEWQRSADSMCMHAYGESFTICLCHGGGDTCWIALVSRASVALASIVMLVRHLFNVKSVQSVLCGYLFSCCLCCLNSTCFRSCHSIRMLLPMKMKLFSLYWDVVARSCFYTYKYIFYTLVNLNKKKTKKGILF